MFALVELSNGNSNNYGFKSSSSSESPPAHVSSRYVEERDSQSNKFKSESVLVGSPSSSAFVLGSGGHA
jgi:hypothetical protein